MTEFKRGEKWIKQRNGRMDNQKTDRVIKEITMLKQAAEKIKTLESEKKDIHDRWRRQYEITLQYATTIGNLTKKLNEIKELLPELLELIRETSCPEGLTISCLDCCFDGKCGRTKAIDIVIKIGRVIKSE